MHVLQAHTTPAQSQSIGLLETEVIEKVLAIIERNGTRLAAPISL